MRLAKALLSMLIYCCSVAKSCLILCDPMDCSMPGFPVLYHPTDFAQTHVHWVGDAIQLSHSLSPYSPVALNLSQHQSLFGCVGSSHPSGGQSIGASASVSVLSMNIQGWFPLGLMFDLLAVQGTLKSLLQYHNSKHQFFCAQLSLWSNSHIHRWLLVKP